MKLSDRAIADRAEDVLGRWGIAKTIYELIADAQTDSALRIGVYGSWGEGKTSVLRFIESLCLKAGIPVCWFSVWSAQTQPELWAELFHALQSLADKPDRVGKIKAAGGKLLSGVGPLADLNKYTKAAHSLAKLANLNLGAEDAKRIIDTIGASTRVVVLVDDVDRVDSALVPKVLMGLHDLFDELGRCAFVIALDPAVVSGGLSVVNPAWSSAPAFLEKSVQYPFRIPRPTEDQMRRLVVEALGEGRLNIPQQAILDVLDLLPPNPRKVKQFIRSLQRLRPTLARYGDDEWNPTLLLLLDLLRTVSADAAEELLQDTKFIQELVLGMVFKRKEEMHEGDKITKEQHARIVAAVARTMPRASEDERTPLVQQITEIASAAVERLSMLMPSDATRMVRLDHEPPVMTLREFDAVVEAWRRDVSATHLSALLLNHSEFVERSEAEVLEACAAALLIRRGQLVDRLADTFGSGEAQQLIDTIETHSSLLERLIVDRNLLSSPQIPSRVTLFLTMRTQAAQFTNRLSDDVYGPIRESLREQLFRAAADLKDRASDVLKDLKPWDRSDVTRDVAGFAELKETREQLNKTFAEFLCVSVLDRFKRPGGVAAIGNFSHNPGEIWLLVTPGTPLHEPEWRSRLVSIAQEQEEGVAQNFFVYLQMLLGELGSTRSPLVTDIGLVVPAWKAASRVRPQPKMHGQVIEMVKRLREAVKDESLIPMPSWATPSQDGQEVTNAGGASDHH